MEFHGREISLAELGAMAATSEFAINIIKKEWVSSYEEFVESVYDSIDKAFALLEKSPQSYFDDAIGEDKITEELANMLVMAGFDARQGQTQGGNVDLTVMGKKTTWSWIGEAKIFSTNTSLKEGLLQLTTRYRNASPLHAQAGILAYVKRANAVGCLQEWRTEVEGMVLPDLSLSECNRRGPLAFFTTHKHEATGLPIKIRHTAISLYHLPKDKSGRGAKKFAAAHSMEAAEKPAK